MIQEQLFAKALGLSEPWYIQKVEFETVKEGVKELHIWIDFTRGARFTMEDGNQYPVYSTVERQWRHLNFFQHKCFLHAWVPRIKMPNGSTVQAEIPWAQPGSSFTLLFEAYVLALVQNEMNLTKAGQLVNVDPRVIGRMVRRYVQMGLANTPVEDVETIGIDETSIAKGHNYMTVISDLEKKQVLAVSLGKDRGAAEKALKQICLRGLDKSKVKYICMDLSPAYISFAMNKLPEAEIVFDRFHIEKLLNEAIDHTRRAEQFVAVALKKTRYLWLRNPSSLTPKQQDKVHYLSIQFPTLGEAYRLKHIFKYIWNEHTGDQAIEALQEWIRQATLTKNQFLLKFVNTLKAHWSGIVTFFYKRITNAFAERVNLKIQEAKRRAKGYRNPLNYMYMIYFLCGGLDMPYLQKTA
jgi:transposase